MVLPVGIIFASVVITVMKRCTGGFGRTCHHPAHRPAEPRTGRDLLDQVVPLRLRDPPKHCSEYEFEVAAGALLHMRVQDAGFAECSFSLEEGGVRKRRLRRSRDE